MLDLLSLTCALYHPADRIAWLSVLRAPWCGLSLADLLCIAKSDRNASMLERINKSEVIQSLSPDGQLRLRQISCILTKCIAQRERYNLRAWIENTWQLLGGPATLTDESDLADAHAYFQLLEKLSDNNIDMHLLKEKIEQLYASTPEADESLQIMTIHAAKGLEFDNVIIPHLEKKLPSDHKALLNWMERPLLREENALLLAPIHAIGDPADKLYEYIVRQQKIKSAYEVDRLLYVAATRAKKRLYLTFQTSQYANENYRIESGSFLEKLWPFFKNQITSLLPAQLATDELMHPLEKTPRSLKRLTLQWQNPITAAENTLVSYHRQAEGFLLKDKRLSVVGTVTHKILQKISELKSNWWLEKNSEAQYQFIAYHLKQHGLVSEKEFATAIMQAISNTLNDSRGQWILKQHAHAKSEFAVAAVINEKVETLIIDRTFVDENDVRWIIDYKTSTMTHQDLDDFLVYEQDKYREKMQLYYSAMRLQESRAIRLGLFFPAVPGWIEWDPV